MEKSSENKSNEDYKGIRCEANLKFHFAFGIGHRNSRIFQALYRVWSIVNHMNIEHEFVFGIKEKES